MGYFNTGNPGPTTPLSFLHVYNEFVPLPANGSIADHSETFRTQVGAGQNQNWRMVRGQLEIGRLYHTNPNNSFRIRVVQPPTVLQPAAHLFLENSEGDGLRISANSVGAVGQTVNGYLLDRRGYVALGSAAGWTALNHVGPWSRLHLTHQDQGIAPPMFGYRPPMRNGITLTGMSDLAYIGQWYDQGTSGTGAEVDDNSNLVIATSDDALPAGLGHQWDHISFRFMGGSAQGQGSASGVQGLEMMRIRPFRAAASDPVQGHVGIGDFLAAGTGPEQRLDILDGKLRIRQLPTDAPGSTLDKYMVVDNSGLVHWRTLPASATCQWNMVNNNPVTAYSSNPCPPGQANKVGIGRVAPAYKLDVLEQVADQLGNNTAIRAEAEGASGEGIGVWALVKTPSGGQHGTTRRGVYSESENATGFNAGVWSEARLSIAQSGTGLIGNRGIYGHATMSGSADTKANYGVEGQASGSGGSVLENLGVRGYANGQHLTINTRNAGVYGRATSWSNNVGVAGDAVGSATTNTGLRGDASQGTTNYGVYGRGFNTATNNYGVYGTASGATNNYGVYGAAVGDTTGNTWAGYFAGKVGVTGHIKANAYYQWSDAGLKTNVNDLQHALDAIAQLNPRTYSYQTQAFPDLNLPQGDQAGFIAQEVEQVLPQLVMETVKPAQYDSTGAEIHAEATFLSMNYTSLIPYLVAGMQEQQAQLADQQQQLSQLQQQLVQLQQQLVQCCAATIPVDGRGMVPAGTPDGGPGDQRLRIQPNPFGSHTTVVYTLERAAQVRLEVADAQGRLIQVLDQGQKGAGEHRTEWNTAAIIPGQYVVRLLVDGEPRVEKTLRW